jgi:hypothetical protein
VVVFELAQQTSFSSDHPARSSARSTWEEDPSACAEELTGSACMRGIGYNHAESYFMF